MATQSELEEILLIALQQGGEFAEIFLEHKRSTGIGCEADKIERINSGLDIGAGIRVISAGNTSYAYTNDISITGLKNVAEVVARAARGGNKGKKIDLRMKKPQLNFSIVKMPDQIGIEAKVEMVNWANKAARGVDTRVKQVAVVYGDVIQQVTIANSNGTLVEDERVRTRLMVNVIAQDGEVIQTGLETLGGLQGFELFDRKITEELAAGAARRAVKMLQARPAPAGRMAVVMAGEAGGTMVHEACGHGLEADLVQKKLSVYAGKTGQEVASPLVTVVDDATIEGKYGSFRFDDEGNIAQKTVLIDKGVLKTYLYDYLTASKDEKSSTGNGRRESYHHKPIPRMTNTYIAPGNDDPGAIIRDTSKGLYVKKMGGGQVNTTTGDFVFDVTEGYLIDHGQIGEAVRGATLIGNGPQVLKIIDKVGNDLGFAIGTCGKDGQGVPVGDAQPTIRIPELTVGGRMEG